MKWSPNKDVAADFLSFLCSAERSNAMYKASGAFSSSPNLDPSVVTDQPGKDLYEALQYSLDGISNSYTPPFLDNEGFWMATQKLFTGEYDAEKAIDHMVGAIAKWKEQYPDSYKSFQEWAEGLK